MGTQPHLTEDDGPLWGDPELFQTYLTGHPIELLFLMHQKPECKLNDRSDLFI